MALKNAQTEYPILSAGEMLEAIRLDMIRVLEEHEAEKAQREKVIPFPRRP